MIEHKIPTTAELKAYHHALAFTIARLANQDLIHDIKVAINSALNNGTSLADFTKQLTPYLIKQGWISDNKQLARRLAIIYDTNLSTAYAQGRWQKIQDTKQLLPYLQYMSSTAKHKRDEHTAYYGLIRHVDDPIWRSIFPPNGFGCKCWVKQLTAQEAQDLGISDDDTVAKLPKPEFDTNHDRLTALLRLASDRHGSVFTSQIALDLKAEMVDYATKQGMKVVDFAGIVARKSEVERLSVEPVKAGQKPKTPRYAEGEVADLWQQYFNVQLVRYDDRYHKASPTGSPPDFAKKDHQLPVKEWLTLDMMYTIENGSNIEAYLHSLTKSDIAWQKQKDNILAHIAKSDIVPLDLRHFDAQRLVKMIAFVLSLPQEQRQKIVIIGG